MLISRKMLDGWGGVVGYKCNWNLGEEILMGCEIKGRWKKLCGEVPRELQLKSCKSAVLRWTFNSNFRRSQFHEIKFPTKKSVDKPWSFKSNQIETSSFPPTRKKLRGKDTKLLKIQKMLKNIHLDVLWLVAKSLRETEVRIEQLPLAAKNARSDTSIASWEEKSLATTELLNTP
jgi:hypothetical protein